MYIPYVFQKRKLKNCRGGQPHARLEGSQFYEFSQQTFTRRFLWEKFMEIEQNNIQKVMTLCVNWHFKK